MLLNESVWLCLLFPCRPLGFGAINFKRANIGSISDEKHVKKSVSFSYVDSAVKICFEYFGHFSAKAVQFDGFMNE